jgi:hypothetical protein
MIRHDHSCSFIIFENLAGLLIFSEAWKLTRSPDRYRESKNFTHRNRQIYDNLQETNCIKLKRIIAIV